MRIEDARFSKIYVNRNIEIAGIKLIDEDTGRITADLVTTMEHFSADPRVPLIESNMKSLSSDLQLVTTNVSGLVDNLQNDLSDLRVTVESNFNEIDLLKNTMVVDARVTDIEQNVQTNTEAIGLIESQQAKVQANVKDLHALIATLTDKVNQLESAAVSEAVPFDVRILSVSNTRADFTITGGDAAANISVDVNNSLTEFKYTNDYSLSVSPGVNYNVGFIQAGLPETLLVSFKAPSSASVAVLLDTVTNHSVSFVVEGPVPVEHRGNLVVSLKTANGSTSNVANKTLDHYTGAPTSSVFDNLTANTSFVLTVSANNIVLVSAEFTTTA